MAIAIRRVSTYLHLIRSKNVRGFGFSKSQTASFLKLPVISQRTVQRRKLKLRSLGSCSMSRKYDGVA